MTSERHISIVIANYNMAPTIGKCLEAAFSSKYENFEVIVVDDHSKDNSIEIIEKFPCKLICLEKHAGASIARNTGVSCSNSNTIFFTDADCLLKEDALSIANNTLSSTGPETVIGGTYTKIPYDVKFFSLFQSIYINYSETKNIENPDYIPTHAMIIDREIFKKNNGLSENFLPILEDVEFSHRLRKAGCRLIINPDIQVQHIFNFSLLKSIQNALKKARFWTIYSISNRDMFADSGTASLELKVNVALYFLNLMLLFLWILLQKTAFLYIAALFFFLNIFLSRKLFKTFQKTRGILFAVTASLYYTIIYPLPVGAGVFSGIVNLIFRKKRVK